MTNPVININILKLFILFEFLYFVFATTDGVKKKIMAIKGKLMAIF